MKLRRVRGIHLEPDRFWRKVERQSDGCWTWTGKLDSQGYGVFSPSVAYADMPREIRAHRYSALLAGMIEYGASGTAIDHACHNGSGCPAGPCVHRACVNPSHLEPKSNVDNVKASHNSHGAKVTCANGHEFTEENTRVRREGWRVCRACHRDRERERKRAA